MKVVMVGPAPDIVGGMSTVAATLRDEFSHDPTVQVRVIDSGGGRGAIGYRRFPSALATVMAGRFDVLHLHVASRGSTLRKAIMALAARLRGRPYVIHLHGAGYGGFLDGLGRAPRALLRTFFLRAGGIIVLGEAWRTLLAEKLDIPVSLVSVVHNGVRQPVPTSSVDPQAPRTVAFVGELSRRKGADILVASWRALVGRGVCRGWRCVCLGPLPDSDVREAIEALPPDVRASFEAPGSVQGSAKDALVSSASIFCLPSRAEGLPMALLEAMAAGVPAVCTPVGSISEVVDESNGRLVEPGSVPALTASLTELMQDPELRQRLGSGARRTWQESFTSGHMAERVRDVWAAAIRGDGDG